MKMLRGWTVSAALVLAATVANAQGAPQATSRPGYVAASDFSGPYADVPPGPPVAAYGPREYGPAEYGPSAAPPLMPPREVYLVLRENGFSPLGVPRLRGMFYNIAVIDRRGDDGHLVIDARDGRIVRFMPAYRMGSRFEDGRPYLHGYGYGPAPMNYQGGPPRPPLAVPREASRTAPLVPVPKAAPLRTSDEKVLVEKPATQPLQQSAAVQGRAADAPPQSAAVIDAKPPAPSILPTQPMPKVQDLE
ncbi:MAG TPA: hypothetical protein VFV07_02410 [Rhizomicrobium sp.]|nr:hypothetical protein [Rhizomicrobium sp.]